MNKWIIVLFFFSTVLLQSEEIVLQNGVNGYNGCQDQLMISHDEVFTYTGTNGGANHKNAALAYFRC